jgi:hypothetical protein
MKEIQLTQGKVAQVDDEDYEWLNQWKWTYKKSLHTGYAYRHGPRPVMKTIRMHRFILQASENIEVDHIDCNGLNNQRNNLRICNRSENLCNQRCRIDNTSGYKGVSWNKHFQKWEAYIIKNGIKKFLGLFSVREEAAQAYNLAAIIYHGRFARQNKIEG